MCPHIPLNPLHPHVPSPLYCSFNNVFLPSTVVLLPFPCPCPPPGQCCQALGSCPCWRWGWDQGTPSICQEHSSHSVSSPLWRSRDFHAWTLVGREVNRKKGQSCVMSSSEVAWLAEKAVCTTGGKPCWEQCLTSDLQSLIPWRPAAILFAFSAFHSLLSAPICVFPCMWFCPVVFNLPSTIPITVAYRLLHSNQCS